MTTLYEMTDAQVEAIIDSLVQDKDIYNIWWHKYSEDQRESIKNLMRTKFANAYLLEPEFKLEGYEKAEGDGLDHIVETETNSTIDMDIQRVDNSDSNLEV